MRTHQVYYSAAYKIIIVPNYVCQYMRGLERANDYGGKASKLPICDLIVQNGGSVCQKLCNKFQISI